MTCSEFVRKFDVFVPPVRDPRDRTPFGAFLALLVLIACVLYLLFLIAFADPLISVEQKSSNGAAFTITIRCSENNSPLPSAPTYCAYGVGYGVTQGLPSSCLAAVGCYNLSAGASVTLDLCYSDDPIDGLRITYPGKQDFGLLLQTSTYDSGKVKSSAVRVGFGTNMLLLAQTDDQVARVKADAYNVITFSHDRTTSDNLFSTGAVCMNLPQQGFQSANTSTAQIRMFPYYTVSTYKRNSSVVYYIGAFGGAASLFIAFVEKFRLFLHHVRSYRKERKSAAAPGPVPITQMTAASGEVDD